MSSGEKEARRLAAIRNNEARREARALAAEEAARRREALKVAEASAREAISRQLQEARRASMPTPEQKAERRRAAAAVARAAYSARAKERRAGKLAGLLSDKLVVPEGWLPMTAAASSMGMACSTASKYVSLGLVPHVTHKGRKYVDPQALRSAFLARQVANLAMLRDNIHKVRLARHIFCGTVTE
jgi:hypothetical protein